MPHRPSSDGFEEQRSTEFRDSPGADSEAPLDPQQTEALDEVVRATLASSGSDETLTRAEIAVLQQVARRWGDVPLTLDPIAVDLVEAIVTANYGPLSRSPQQWRTAATRIAHHLFNSPVAHARLHNLWRRLLESLR